MHEYIDGEWRADKGNGLHVHTLESVLNAKALKKYFPKLHNSFRLFTLRNLINLNMEGLPR